MLDDELRAWSNALSGDDLSILTVVRVARDDLTRGELETAILRLRIDADKIRALSPALYEMIALRARDTTHSDSVARGKA
ncbi:hypothetical protein [Burkholderia gladioli]|uniref:hypothetical protein n=1 Tax=Burkholderia gladioli TaxID=28095 RepID=UPI000D00DAE8|nr:hypothetical protein [Burkholderia gladioli]MDN7465756.1 hypothetical protein [Burkholderia gladioli]MDN7812924.1 hypothetical protein [Burkholderia gladioli]PRE10762.1 hypothetical protein C6P72_34600 [Burkholderia gladioli]